MHDLQLTFEKSDYLPMPRTLLTILQSSFVVCCVPSMVEDLQGPHRWRGMLKCKKCLFYCTPQVEGATATACLDMVCEGWIEVFIFRSLL